MCDMSWALESHSAARSELRQSECRSVASKISEKRWVGTSQHGKFPSGVDSSPRSAIPSVVSRSHASASAAGFRDGALFVDAHNGAINVNCPTKGGTGRSNRVAYLSDKPLRPDDGSGQTGSAVDFSSLNFSIR